VAFPLADWIDSHPGCRYDLGRSGMRDAVRVPVPSAREVRDASEPELVRRIASGLDVDASRVFLTHGASEANAWVTLYRGRRARGRAPVARVELPEYPPLCDLPRWAGFRLDPSASRVDLAVVSQPRNPVGDRWDPDRLAGFAAGARAVLVDETFREFTEAPSMQRRAIPHLWTTGSFTKVYGADSIRVGYAVAPEEERDPFARFHALVADDVPPYSVATALAILERRRRILSTVRSIFERNRAAWRRASPGGPSLAGPTAFDTDVGPDGDGFARRCLHRSILVCPGSFFGAPAGVRVCLTRPSFPRDLSRYLAAREAARERRDRISDRTGTPTVRRRRTPTSRAGGGRA
jgi:histidinol-phosphate/aromatic aminotransferase/cobyric acid decarboxylase-like protein